jgi:hypothetical protein
MVWSFLGLLIQLAVFGACVYYVMQKQGSDSYLLVIGAFVHLLTSLFYTVGIRVFSFMSIDIYSNQSIFGIVGFFSLVGTFCFSAGFVILILEYLKLFKDKISIS